MSSGQRRRILLAALSGVLLAFAYPMLSLWWLAWVALVPLYLAVGGLGDKAPFPLPLPPASGAGGPEGLSLPTAEASGVGLLDTPAPEAGGRGRGKGANLSAFLPGFTFGLILFLVGLFWMNEIGALPWFVLACIQALPFALMTLVCAVLMLRLPVWARPLAFAALWTLAEWARTQGKLAFPWFMLSSSQVRALPLAQIVDITGQWGLSFAIATVNGLLGEAWQKRKVGQPLRFIAAAGAIIGVLLAYGIPQYQRYDSLPTDGPGTRAVAVAQGSFSKNYSGDGATEALATYLDLSRDAAVANPRPELILWPETVVPFGLMNSQVAHDAVTRLARDQRTALLVGTTHMDAQDNYYNSAALINAQGEIVARYDKIRLVPVGEFFPLRGLLKSIYARYGVPDRDMTSGPLGHSLTLDSAEGRRPLRLGPMICYESVFPDYARAQARDGAQILTLVTSDQTFGTSAGPYQHADQSAIRAIETRRPLVRAASTGVSEFINPAGRVTASLGLNERGVLSRQITPRTELTLFVQWGDWFVWLCGAIVVAAVVMAIRRSALSSPSPEPASAAD